MVDEQKCIVCAKFLSFHCIDTVLPYVSNEFGLFRLIEEFVWVWVSLMEGPYTRIRDQKALLMGLLIYLAVCHVN
jgi:hypothetical protein